MKRADGMDKQLFGQAMIKFFAGLLIVSALVFVPAGTLRYPQGLLFTAILFVPMFLAGLVMMAKAPDLLRRRLAGKETEEDQKKVIALSGVMFIAAFVVAGLNFRFGWLILPKWVPWVAAAVFLLSYALYAEVMRENAYLSRTVSVAEGQQVVDTGMYGIVRHPMYAVTLVLFLSMPLVLGSLFSFVIMLAYIPMIAVRIRGEEAFLEEELEGYKEYKQRVRWKVIPHVW